MNDWFDLQLQISAAWLKCEIKSLDGLVEDSLLVEKLTVDNTRFEKERVMNLFKDM